MAFGFSGNAGKSSSTSSPGFGAGSMAAGRASERSNYGGSTSSSKSSTASSSKGSTATAAGRGSNAATGSKSSGAGATGGRVGTGSTSANKGSISGGGDVGRFGGGSTGTTGKGFGAATGMSSTGSMAAARANDRASVAGYAGRPSATSTTTGTRVGAGSMAAARAADRASVTGYSGANAAAPGTMANARAADRASVPGYSAVSPPSGRTTLRGLGTAVSRMSAPTSQALAERMGLTVPGLSATPPGQVTNAPLGVVQNIPGGIPMGATVSALPDLAKAPKAFVNWNGVTRPTTDVADRIAASWAEELGPENVQINAVSGLRTAKGKATRSHRHGPDVGTALDYGVSIKDPKTGSWRTLDLSKVADKALATRVSKIGMAKYGLQGAGFGLGYMGDKSIHHDIYTNLSPQQSKQWAGAKVSAAAFNEARAAYQQASKAPARPSGPAQPVSSMIANAERETTPQMAALDAASGVTRPTAVASNVSRVTSPQSAAARPSTPGSVQSSAAQPAATRPAATAASVATPASRPVGTPVSRPAVQTNGKIPGGLAIQTPTKENPYKRSPTGQVVAAGIDVLSGPLGAVASLGTGLLLGTTVGGAAWDAAHGKYGENQYSPGDENQREGGGAGGYTMAQRNADKATAKTADGGAGTSTPAEDFVTKYIETSDPTWKSPAIRFTSSVEPMVLTPPKYNFEAPTAPFTYRRV